AAGGTMVTAAGQQPWETMPTRRPQPPADPPTGLRADARKRDPRWRPLTRHSNTSGTNPTLTGFPYLRTRPRRNVEVLLRTPAVTAAIRSGCGKGLEFLFRSPAHAVHSFGRVPNDGRRLPVP